MGDFLVEFINEFISALGVIISSLLGLLPNSPFTSVLGSSTVSSYLPYLAWIIPITQILAIFQAWLSSIIIYYVYQVVLRWIKLIQ